MCCQCGPIARNPIPSSYSLHPKRYRPDMARAIFALVLLGIMLVLGSATVMLMLYLLGIIG